MPNEIRYCFIVGTGRSGTHLITSLLRQHEMIEDLLSGKENPNILKNIAESSQNNSINVPDVNINYYEERKKSIGDKIFLDQSHPNLFFVDDLSNRLGGTRFIAMWRDTRAVVASMLRHKGVLNWYKSANKRPFPNQFLGMVGRDDFDKLSLLEKCTLRVVAHKNRIIKEQILNPEIFKVIYYESICADAEFQINSIFNWLKISKIDKLTADIKNLSVTKWQTSLSNNEIDIINNIEFKFSEYNFINQTKIN